MIQDQLVSSLYDTLVDQQHVNTVKLDDLNLPRMDFYKLDVEGFELSALEGSRATISKHRPFMWIEFWKVGLGPINYELSYLDNYDSIVMDSLNVLYAPREKMEALGIKIINKE